MFKDINLRIYHDTQISLWISFIEFLKTIVDLSSLVKNYKSLNGSLDKRDIVGGHNFC